MSVISGVFVGLPLLWDGLDAARYKHVAAVWRKAKAFDGAFVSNVTAAHTFGKKDLALVRKYRFHELTTCTHYVLFAQFDVVLQVEDFELMALAKSCGIDLALSKIMLPDNLLPPTVLHAQNLHPAR